MSLTATASNSQTNPVEQAKQMALRLLTSRPRSRATLVTRLTEKGVAEADAQTAVDRLAAVGLVDDQALARNLVHDRHTQRGLVGPALVQELRRQAIPDDLAANALAELSEEQVLQQAVKLAARKLAATAGLDKTVQLRRTQAYLARRGYTMATINQAIAAARS
ncbi:MAG: recombination regulator RecX [Bifidobacteriaceae bacterium]|jgi:regulatory protein|nr:recombination regulator RecX [Bifidobacteriaceae bacterium]